MELGNPRSNGNEASDRRFTEDIDSNCSTPYVSAPSSPGRGPPTNGCYFFSAPASPMHYILSSAPYSNATSAPDASVSNSFEFDFSARCPAPPATADELFLNGQIRPMKLSSHLQRPQALTPLIDVGAEEEEDDDDVVEAVRGRDVRMRSRSLHRRARSMSPLRNSRFQWTDEEKTTDLVAELDLDQRQEDTAAEATPEATSASASRSSSSSGRNSKRWVFLKDLLYRSKSEGRNTTTSKEKFWHSLSFSPASSKGKSSKEPPAPPPAPPSAKKKKKKKGPAAPARPTNAVGKRRVPSPSPHERHYTANRAVAEEMRRRTFLPYRQGLLGCLGFSSRSYGAVNGFARSLTPVSTRDLDFVSLHVNGIVPCT